MRLCFIGPPFHPSAFTPRSSARLFSLRIGATISVTERSRSMASNDGAMSAGSAPETLYAFAQRSRMASGVRLQRFVL